MAKQFTEKKNSQHQIMYLPTINYPILSGLIFGLIIFFYFPFIIRKKKIDVIIIDDNSVWSPFFLSWKLFNVPILIWDIRSLPIDKKISILTDISLFLSKYIVDGFTTITPELQDIFINRYKIKSKKIGIWSSGVTINYLEESISNENKILGELNLKNFILLYHGTYAPTRGIENLIYSIAELDKSIQNNITLLLVGIPQNKKKDLILLCKKLKIAEHVKIILPVDNRIIPVYIQSSTVGIIPLPPNNEWWRVSVPLKTLEYLAMGKPIIATNIPFHQKIFKIAEVGVLLDTNSPKAIANAVTYLFNNQEKLIEMGKLGKEIVEKYYTWDHIAVKLEDFINNLLGDLVK